MLTALTLLLASTAAATTHEQLRHSKHVVAFFDNRPWMRAPNQPNCQQVPWARTCQIARKVYAHHFPIVKRHDAYARIAAKLDHGLRGTPMAGTGTELEAAGRAHGIHPAFIAAIAATESSYGAAMCGNYNAYGLGNCTGIWNVPAFRSWEESYRFMGKFLSSRWPHADTPWEFYGYAACDSCWGNKVAFYMSRLGFGHGVRYR